MELLNHDHEVLLIKFTSEDHKVLMDVLRVSPTFEYDMWGGLDEDELKQYIEMVEKRGYQEELSMSRDEFLVLFDIVCGAAHGLDITYRGLEKEPVVKLAADFRTALKQLPPRNSYTSS